MSAKSKYGRRAAEEAMTSRPTKKPARETSRDKRLRELVRLGAGVRASGLRRAAQLYAEKRFPNDINEELALYRAALAYAKAAKGGSRVRK